MLLEQRQITCQAEIQPASSRLYTDIINFLMRPSSERQFADRQPRPIVTGSQPVFLGQRFQ